MNQEVIDLANADITGVRSGKLVAIRATENRYKGSVLWEIKCDCGTVKEMRVGAFKEASHCGLCRRSSKNSFEVFGETVIGRTTKGEEFYFDLSDLPNISQFTWFIHHGYPTARVNKQGHSTLHRCIFGFPEAFQIDHIDGNTLNNRRINLRPTTQQENCMNRRKRSDSLSSSYKGVSFCNRRKKWQSQIMKKGVHYHMGFFNDEIEAARAYNIKALELHGEFAKLNVLGDY